MKFISITFATACFIKSTNADWFYDDLFDMHVAFTSDGFQPAYIIPTYIPHIDDE